MTGSGTWRLRRYAESDGSEPFTDWLNGLDTTIQRRVRVALSRIEAGNLSAVKWIDRNLGEYRMDTGPGYRIYLTRHGKDELVLLNGGDKHSQSSDIADAKSYIVMLKKL
jgi:putative addiction module killer protein